MSNLIPKSLHTIRVFVEMGKLYKANHDGVSTEDAVFAVAALLGYATTPDGYGLQAKAVDAINKGK